MKAAYITNSDRKSGIGTRAAKIREGLVGSSWDLMEVEINGGKGVWRAEGKEQGRIKKWPGMLGSKSVNWIRLGRKVDVEAQVYHLTSQSLSFMAKRLKPAVVTVHDLIELTDSQDDKAYWLNRYLYSGIKEADQVIAVSEYTAGEVVKYYGIKAEKIRVIPNGVDPEDFYPIEGFRESIAYATWKNKIKAGDKSRVIIYVGSEHPRKNIGGLLAVFKRVREAYPKTILIKVGVAGIREGRKYFLEKADELRVREGIRIYEGIPTRELNELYNLADVLVYPTKNEGFGLPVLEAMAAGTPVVASNAASLPEVAGDAALLTDPDNSEGMAESVTQIFEDEGRQKSMAQAGIGRAELFSWQKAANDVSSVYSQIVNYGKGK